jgi:O-antigen ligase
MRNLIKVVFLVLILLIGVIYLAQGITSFPDIAVFSAIGLGLGLITFIYPQVGIYFVLFATLLLPEIPIGSVKTGLSGASREIGIRPEDILVIAIVFGWFARIVARREKIDIPHNPLNTPIIILSVIMVIATLFGILFGDVSLSAGFFYTLKRLEYFLIFFMVITNINTTKEVKIGVAFLLIAAALVALYGTIEHLTLADESRISGPFQRSQASILGGFLIIIIFLSLSFILNYRSIFLRLVLLVLIGISFYTVMWTRSRSTYTAFSVGLIIFALLIRKPILIIIPILLIVFMSQLLPEAVVQSIWSIKAVYSHEEFNPSWSSRVDAWEGAISYIFNRPLLGYGLGAFDLAWTDSQYVHDVLSIGLIGLGLFIWLIIRLFKNTWAIYRDSNEIFNKTLAIGFIGGLVCLLIQGVAMTNFYTIRTMVPFWFLTGLVMVTYHLKEEQVTNLHSPIADVFETT